jgi:hypothetical protein
LKNFPVENEELTELTEFLPYCPQKNHKPQLSTQIQKHSRQLKRGKRKHGQNSNTK